ncbi:hypothetical protein [Streptomyces atratus]|uniref:hypothetical protein n=1 Tax=Streptomyces atratus TaxID=1893 RepID=UPI0021A2D612|nr:hypothetical protein [Streptomyces atratus]MCT2544137.1 hypothetical protein [Streptomyces atratus]
MKQHQIRRKDEGRYSNGEHPGANLHGLPVAFFWAGSSAVANCLWPVAPYVAAKCFGTLCEQPAVTSDRRTVGLIDRKAQVRRFLACLIPSPLSDSNRRPTMTRS